MHSEKALGGGKFGRPYAEVPNPTTPNQAQTKRPGRKKILRWSDATYPEIPMSLNYREYTLNDRGINIMV